MSKIVSIGNAGGYWGDDLGALKRQLELGPLDYITQDYLAEITMSILQKQRLRNPDLGYAADFIVQISDCFDLLTRQGTRLISNAGGINPLGCAEAVDAQARQRGISLSIAVVEGDDLLGKLDDLMNDGHPLSNMETGQPLSTVRDRVLSANVYLGAEPVVRALGEGVQIVLAGRVTDTGVTAAPPIHEFGWDFGDWDRLAGAVVAGHILECGAQASGGNLTDWHTVPSFRQMAYPIAEVESDGSFTVTKHSAAGGKVDRSTVCSQLVYEMGDPLEYITPDVIADFTSIQLSDAGRDRVRVSGVRGRPRPENLKVSISYRDGFKAHGTVIVSAPRAADKARKISEILWSRLDLDFEETSSELVGLNACHGPTASPVEPTEILLRLGVRDHDKAKIDEFSKLFASLILSTVSGVAIVGARPRIQEVVAYWPCLVPANLVTPTVSVLHSKRSYSVPRTELPSRALAQPDAPPVTPPTAFHGPTRRATLEEICYGRSGDKGDTGNIGLVARSHEAFEWLVAQLTADSVKSYFGSLCKGDVERFVLPNLLALNFLLHESLGGGGTVSLRIDPQGKTLADALLRREMDIPEEVLASVQGG